MTNRLTQRELRAIDEALAFRLAGEIEDGDPGVYASAQEKIRSRIKEDS
jgi:hypothetical protein